MIKQAPTHPIVDKIRKLLALSKSNNVNEAAVAASKAKDLMLEHGLTIGDLTDQESIIDIDDYMMDKKTDRWLLPLWASASAYYFCLFYYMREPEFKSSVQPVLIGTPAAVMTCRMMMGYFEATINRLAILAGKHIETREKDAYMGTFRTACATRLAERLSEARISKKVGKGNLPVPLNEAHNTMDRVLRQWLNTRRPGTKVVSYQGIITHRKAHSAGRKAAEDIGLDPQVAVQEEMRRLEGGEHG